MINLFERLKATELSRMLVITPEAVRNAKRKGVIPTTWIPALIQYGYSVDELLEQPIQPDAKSILKTITASYHMKRKSPKTRKKRQLSVTESAKENIV